MSPPTPLELVLPIGRAESALVLGAGAPERLRAQGGGGPAELVIVAPNRVEAETLGWMDESISQAIAAAAPGGMIYLLLPPAQRRRAISRLAGNGYSTTMFLHYPSLERTEYLVPGDRQTLRRWLESGEGTASARRRLARIALAVPGTDRGATRLLPSVGVAALRSEGPAPFQWLSRLSGARVVRGLVRAKWRAGRGGAVVTGLDGTGRAVVVAKIALGGPESEARATHEVERLERLGPAVRAAGARLPSPTLSALPGGWPVLLLSPLTGRPAARLLGSGAMAVDAVIAELGEWLVRWNEATVAAGRLDEGWAQRELLGPAVRLAPDLNDGEWYRQWLRARTAEALGEPLSTVATHGDLTMSNVLLGDGPPAIVDWEAASSTGLPLRDLLYSAVDATAARDGYRDRVAAFVRCFPDGTGVSGSLGRLLDRLRRSAGLSERTTTLCVHACWLQHAADEQAKRAPGEPRPFLEIVRRLAERARVGQGAP
ncbi:MAG TPA: phosphotransferase [Gemmatimonadales bacterium]|nr:phosphotransferase [Gemmatimonadales bacterium]